MATRTLVVASMILLAPVSLWAQQGTPAPQAPAEPAEPQLPSSPTEPTDFQAPAQPIQAAPAPAAAAPGEAAGGAPTGYSGGDLIITDTNPSLYGGVTMRRKIPRYHAVVEGDTLWSLCDFYYGDPWAWPQLWAYNRGITNPHWIYPGDRIRMLAASEPVARRAPGAERISVSRHARYLDRPLMLKQRAFVDPQELKRSGQIAGSREERLLLSTFDEIYLKGSGQFEPRPGQLYSIYEVKETLRDAKGRKVGHMVEIMGSARIRRVGKNKVATAEIADSFNAIERHFRVGPLRRVFRTLPQRPADKDLKGRIIANLDGTEMVGTDGFVFIDKGQNQGVKAGNRFLVMRHGDGLTSFHPEDDKEQKKDTSLPGQPVAEIAVLDARPDSSVGIVTRALKEVRTGDPVQMRRGY